MPGSINGFRRLSISHRQGCLLLAYQGDRACPARPAALQDLLGSLLSFRQRSLWRLRYNAVPSDPAASFPTQRHGGSDGWDEGRGADVESGDGALAGESRWASGHTRRGWRGLHWARQAGRGRAWR